MARADTNTAEGGVEFRVEKWVYGGRGLGRVDGRVVLVPWVLPGELVRARFDKLRPGLAEASLEEVLEASPDRRTPPCPYFGRCGGCHYQHATYEAQIEGKRGILVETLRRVGGVEPPAGIEVLAGDPWGYRNRLQLHLSGGEVGFHQPASHELCAVARCPIAAAPLNDALTALRKMMRDRRFPRFLGSIELFTNGTEVLVNARDSTRPLARRFFEWCAEGIPGAGAGWLDYAAGGRLFRVSHGSFFQVNRFLIEGLVKMAVQGTGESALDLYAGAGLFTLELAARYGSVTGVESGRSAARDLEFNAARAQAAVTVVRETAEGFLERLSAAPDFILADPPRTGLGRAVVGHLLRLRAPRLTIVACDPATLARDLGRLAVGGYVLERLALIDLFPQSYHLEAVAHLRLS